MRVVFMGTPEFAVPSLRALAAAQDVVAVYTRADAVSGRGGRTRPSPVKAMAQELGIEVRTPRTLRDTDVLADLLALSADLIVVAAYGVILPRAVLEAARLGAVNVHASLLPRWRGAAPIQRAILAGDPIVGVSIMRMEEGLDTGPHCAQASLQLGDRSAPDVMAALAMLGAEALVAALPAIEAGSAAWTTQDETKVTYAEKLSKADVAPSPDLGAEEIVRRVRASMPSAPSRVTLAGRGATLFDARRSDADLAPGSLACTKTSLLLGACDGTVEVHRIKPDGKAEMDGCAWARGVAGFASAMWGGAT